MARRGSPRPGSKAELKEKYKSHVFKEMTPEIQKVIVGWASTVGLALRPQDLTPADVLALCIRKDDLPALQHVTKIARNTLSDITWGERFYTRLPCLGDDDAVGKSTLSFFLGKDDIIVRPDYAVDNLTARPIDTAPPELVARLREKCAEWLRLCANVTLVWHVFNYLNEGGVKTKGQMRYVFPGILPILKRVDGGAELAAKLVETKEHAAIEFERREAVRLANDTVALMATFEGVVTKDPRVTPFMVCKRYQHPLWPEPFDVLGLD